MIAPGPWKFCEFSSSESARNFVRFWCPQGSPSTSESQDPQRAFGFSSFPSAEAFERFPSLGSVRAPPTEDLEKTVEQFSKTGPPLVDQSPNPQVWARIIVCAIADETLKGNACGNVKSRVNRAARFRAIRGPSHRSFGPRCNQQGDSKRRSEHGVLRCRLCL